VIVHEFDPLAASALLVLPQQEHEEVQEENDEDEVGAEEGIEGGYEISTPSSSSTSTVVVGSRVPGHPEARKQARDSSGGIYGHRERFRNWFRQANDATVAGEGLVDGGGLRQWDWQGREGGTDRGKSTRGSLCFEREPEQRGEVEKEIIIRVSEMGAWSGF
jgi:hypothetical protein